MHLHPCCREPLLRLALHTSLDHVLALRGDVLPAGPLEGIRQRIIAVLEVGDVPNDVCVGLAVEGWHPTHQHVGQHAQRPHIHLLAIAISFADRPILQADDLRSYVVAGATHLEQLLLLASAARKQRRSQSKVYQFEPLLRWRGKHPVLQLDISVHDAHAVNVPDCCRHLLDEHCDAGLRVQHGGALPDHRGGARRQLEQLPSGAKLHAEPDLAVLLHEGLQQSTHVRV
mmetsp:Transcript_59329/g.141443  ORF Transcript_59329/g.141443 Transcript_59329/m.141443 type:complete len:229 (-) Transcript_59329:63-749(-)